MQMNFRHPEEEEVNSTFVSGRLGISAGAILGNSTPPAYIPWCCFSWEGWEDTPSPLLHPELLSSVTPCC